MAFVAVAVYVGFGFVWLDGTKIVYPHTSDE